MSVIKKALHEWIKNNEFSGLVSSDGECACFLDKNGYMANYPRLVDVGGWCIGKSVPFDCIAGIEHSCDDPEEVGPSASTIIPAIQVKKDTEDAKKATLKCDKCNRLWIVDLNKSYRYVFCPVCSNEHKDTVLVRCYL